MAEKDISEIVAENLSHWMGKAELTQAALATRAGVSQKTISNYLNPMQRMEGAKGKPGSPKLYELDLIAKALGVEVWQLTREMTPDQRGVYEALEKAYQELIAAASQRREEAQEAEDQRLRANVPQRTFSRQAPRKTGVTAKRKRS